MQHRIKKPYNELDKQLIIVDLNDNPDDPDTLLGISISADDMENFLQDVQDIAEAKYGGATFEELLEYDETDEAMAAAQRRRYQDAVASILKAAEDILKRGK